MNGILTRTGAVLAVAIGGAAMGVALFAANATQFVVMFAIWLTMVCIGAMLVRSL